MNWTLEQINDHAIITPPETMSRSRHLNSFTIFVMNYKFELSKMTPLQQAEWRRNKSPRSSNMHRVSNGSTLWLQRRVNRNAQQEFLLTPFVIIRNDYHNLEANGELTAWKNRARFLNERPPCVDVEINHKVRTLCCHEMKLKILSISWGNLEKLMQMKLKSSNRDCNESGIKKNKTLRDRCTSLPHKIKMKRQVLIKTNLDLSLMWCLFGME